MKTCYTSLSILLLTFLLGSLATNAQTINPFAGNHIPGYSGNGAPATAAECYAPAGIAADNAGNVYFIDQGSSVVRKVNAGGIITTYAGNDTAGYSGNGGPATAASLNQPSSLAIDDTGNLYIADDVNNVIRKVNTAGIITTVAGDGTAGYLGDAGLATNAKLNSPKGIAVDHLGNMYIADANNNVVRKVNTAGFINPFAGTSSPGFFGNDSLAIFAKLHLPTAVAVDASGNVLIVDQVNNMVRRVNTLGVITSFAGTGVYGYSGDGNYADLAKLNTPTEVSADNLGNVYIADYGNHVVRKVTSAGFISTIAGNGTSGYSGDGGYALAAQLAGPYDMAVDNVGKVYISDEINNVVRVVYNNVGIHDLAAGSPGELHVFPDPNNGTFSIEIPGAPRDATLNVVDMMGKVIKTMTVQPIDGKAGIALSGIRPGNYTISVTTGSSLLRALITVQQ